MSEIKTFYVPDEIAYSGEQLQSHWAYRRCDILGESIVSFIGRCDVHPEHMRDVEDLKTSSRIFSERMLHFIVEHFDADMDRIILRQRLLMALMVESLNQRLQAPRILRRGSDLYEGDHKLTVSVATVSPVSSLIHAGINIVSRNTPVPTQGLADYHIEPVEFAQQIMASYAAECALAHRARCKVRGCPEG